MAKKEKKEKAAKKKGGKKKAPVFLLVVISLGLIVTIQMSYIFLLCGILPSIVAYIVDRSPGRGVFHTVFACNLAGVLPFVSELMVKGNKLQDVQMLLADMKTWLIMYAAAGAGWMLVWLGPLIMRGIIGGFYMKEIAQCKSTQRKLVEEWGPELQRKDYEG